MGLSQEAPRAGFPLAAGSFARRRSWPEEAAPVALTFLS